MKHILISQLLIIFLFSSFSLFSQNRGMKAAPQEFNEKRVALVIGNGSYEETPLKNPPNDACTIVSTLQALGFKVISKIDASKKEMRDAINQFGSSIRGSGVGMFYYAGHGIQSNGRNYLIPINASIQSEGDIEDEAVSVDQVLFRMEDAHNRMNIVVLDACRNNPFGGSYRSASRGLAQMIAPTGTFIAYSTSPGSVAADGDGTNGLYTKELVKQMRAPGVKLEDVFKKVLSGVKKSSAGRQIPWISSSVEGDFYFDQNGDETIVVAAPDQNNAERSAKHFPTDMIERGIVFNSNRNGNSEIYRINSDGSGLKRLTNSTGNKNFPRWSPDGTRIAYVDYSTTPGEIFIMNQDGTEKNKITSNNTWGHDNINWPVWMNNNEIIYSGTGGTAHWAFWNVNITTLIHAQIYSESGVVKWATDVDPVSGKILGYAIIDYAHGSDDWLFSCNSNGTNFIRIVNNLGYNNSPTWPRINKGLTKIVYPWDDRKNPNPLWIANTDGSNPVKIANTGGIYHDQMCAFSPDGSKIVAGTQLGRTGQIRLWIINADGSNRAQLTTGTDSYDDIWPDWK